jgi:hypothetical protein
MILLSDTPDSASEKVEALERIPPNEMSSKCRQEGTEPRLLRLAGVLAVAALSPWNSDFSSARSHNLTDRILVAQVEGLAHEREEMRWPQRLSHLAQLSRANTT